MSDDEEEDDGPTKAKKRMLEQNLIHLSEHQSSPKNSVTGVVRVSRDDDYEMSDPPAVPFVASVETVSLVVPHSLSQRSQKSSNSSTASSEIPNFKAFVKKNRMGGNSSQACVSLSEYKLQSFDRKEYQVMTALSSISY